MFKRRRLVYVQIAPDRISLRLVGTGREITETPEIAYEVPSTKVLAIERQAPALARPGVVVKSGFGSHRGIIQDLDLAYLALQYWLDTLLDANSFTKLVWHRIELVLHPLAAPAEGLTPFETWSLSHLGKLANADHVVVWLGDALSDAQLLAGLHYRGKASVAA